MKKKITKLMLMALISITGFISCSEDDQPVNGNTNTSGLQLDKEKLAFGEVETVTNKELNFTITNNSKTVLKITSVNFKGTNKAEFTTTITDKSIDAGKSETFKVVCVPISAGDKSASLELTTEKGTETITLTAKAKLYPTAYIKASKTYVNFKDFYINVGVSETISFYNLGATSVNVRNDLNQFSGNIERVFRLENHHTEIKPGEKIDYKFKFTPKGETVYNASFSFYTSGSSNHIPIVLKGSGKKSVSFEKTLVDFGNNTDVNTDKTMSFKMTNLMNSERFSSPLRIASISLTGYHQNQFAVTSNTGFFVLASGEDSTISVKFKPTSSGVKYAKLIIRTNEAGTYTIDLKGTAPAQ